MAKLINNEQAVQDMIEKYGRKYLSEETAKRNARGRRRGQGFFVISLVLLTVFSTMSTLKTERNNN